MTIIQYQLTCSSTIDKTISSSSNIDLNISKKLDNIFPFFSHSTGPVNNAVVIMNNKMYTLIQNDFCSIDLNTYDITTLSSFSLTSQTVFNLTPDINNNKVHIYTDQGLESYDDNTSNMISDINVKINDRTIYCNGSNNQYGLTINNDNTTTLYDFYNQHQVVVFPTNYYFIYSFIYNNIIYLIGLDGNNQYFSLYYLDSNNNLIKIRDYSSVQFSFASKYVFTNIKNNFYYMPDITQIIKFNINDNSITYLNTSIPLTGYNHNDIIINSNDKIAYIIYRSTLLGSKIISIQQNDEIHVNNTLTTVYPGPIPVVNPQVPISYLDETTLYIIVCDVNETDRTVQNYLRAYDKNLNILYDIGVCGEMNQVTGYNNKIYVLTSPVVSYL